MSCRHDKEVDSCDECRDTAEKRDQDARGIQRAAESRRIRGVNTRTNDEKSSQ